VLQGRMTLRDDGLWDTGWTLQAKAASGAWRSDVTTFDRAIAASIEGSARQLAGLE
jgi:squalene cyclase